MARLKLTIPREEEAWVPFICRVLANFFEWKEIFSEGTSSYISTMEKAKNMVMKPFALIQTVVDSFDFVASRPPLFASHGRCPHCGIRNEPIYTEFSTRKKCKGCRKSYCWACKLDLSRLIADN